MSVFMTVSGACSFPVGVSFNELLSNFSQTYIILPLDLSFKFLNVIPFHACMHVCMYIYL